MKLPRLETVAKILAWCLLYIVVLSVTIGVSWFAGAEQRDTGERSRKYRQENRQRIQDLEERLRQ